jgi:hypothetical protein
VATFVKLNSSLLTNLHFFSAEKVGEEMGSSLIFLLVIKWATFVKLKSSLLTNLHFFSAGRGGRDGFIYQFPIINKVGYFHETKKQFTDKPTLFFS